MPERATVLNRSKKSAEAIVAARRRAEREGESNAMSLGNARHQKPGQPGRTVGGKGEARLKAVRDEAGLVRHVPEGSGRANLLEQVLERENLALAWRRVKSNRGSAGVDGLTIQATTEYLMYVILRPSNCVNMFSSQTLCRKSGQHQRSKNLLTQDRSPGRGMRACMHFPHRFYCC